jgi:hypothetical protein
MAGQAVGRTWFFDWPKADDPSSRHSATLIVDDELVAAAEGEDWLTAAHNLHDVLRKRGIAVDSKVLAFSVFEQMYKSLKRRP